MLSENIRLYRKQKHMTQDELGKKLFTCGRTIFNYESGQRQISATMIPKLCEVLDVTPNQLFDFADVTLADFTTDELLAEIKRRINYGGREEFRE